MGDRIIKALSGFYYVQTADGVVECRARGKMRREKVSPLVGDFVEISRQGAKGTVEAVLPRRNEFIRPAVANIDVLVVLASCAIPVTEPFLIDRVLAIAAKQNVPAIVCVNKDDLASGEKLAHIYRHAGYPVFVTSAETGEGIDALREAISGKLAVFTGNSGVGKSSILNALCPELKLPVGEVSEKLGRGRHTTRHIELYCLGNGTFVADTPGFSSFDTEQMELILTVDSADDDSYRTGLVTKYIPELELDNIHETAAIVVGPPIMMKFAVAEFLKLGMKEEQIWISQERKMCCGLGKCGHCRMNDTYICLDGPVFCYSEGKKLFD